MKIIRTKAGDVVLIGDTIQVRVVRAEGGRATLGIVAPSDVTILRGELTRRSSNAAKGDETGASPTASQAGPDGQRVDPE